MNTFFIRITADKDLQTIFAYSWGDYGSPPHTTHFGMQAMMIYHFTDCGGFYPIGGASEIALNIIPVYNCPYAFIFNPCERLFSRYKFVFRRLLLYRMLQTPNNRETPLLDALRQTFAETFVDDMIPKIIKKALNKLRK